MRIRGNRLGFTLTEMIVVIGVVALLLGLLVPALFKARKGAQKVGTQGQLQSLVAACLSYESSFNALPGYFSEDKFNSPNNAWQRFTSTENLVLSLLGQLVPTADVVDDVETAPPATGDTPFVAGFLPTGLVIDKSKIGSGPRVNSGRVYDAFYKPKPGELEVITGTALPNDADRDNAMPELVDHNQAGLPILYFKAIPGKSQLASDRNNADSRFFDPTANDDRNDSQFFRGPVSDYLDAGNANGTGGLAASKYGKIYNQAANPNNAAATSLLNNVGANNHRNANRNLAWLVMDTKLMELSNPPVSDDSVQPGQPAKGRFMLMTAGDDGIYLNRASLGSLTDNTTRTIDNPDDLDKFDDVIVFGQ